MHPIRRGRSLRIKEPAEREVVLNKSLKDKDGKLEFGLTRKRKPHRV
jgi:hypothetical protein